MCGGSVSVIRLYFRKQGSDHYRQDRQREQLNSPSSTNKSNVVKKPNQPAALVKTMAPRRAPEAQERGRTLPYSPNRNMSPHQPPAARDILEERERILRIQEEETRMLQEEQRKSFLKLEAEAKMKEERWKTVSNVGLCSKIF